MKNSYLNGVLYFGSKLKKKDIVNKAKKNKKKNEERQHTLGWEEKRILDLKWEWERREEKERETSVLEKKMKPWSIVIIVFYFSFYQQDYRWTIKY